MKIVGVDCATVDGKIGLALGSFESARTEILEVTLGTRERPAASVITAWLGSSDSPALIAFDAPLGWPKPLADALMVHHAGVASETPARAMFRRATDLFVEQKLGKRPLEVGADRIARTAHSTLQLLGTLREQRGQPIPLAWSATDVECVAAIEVYPAATLIAHRIRSTGYKKMEQVEQRKEIVQALSERFTLSTPVAISENADLVDAVVCVLAGVDFMTQRAMTPEDRTLGESEGWIWVARPDGH